VIITVVRDIIRIRIVFMVMFKKGLEFVKLKPPISQSSRQRCKRYSVDSVHFGK
jgi:hypothetical protein